MAYYWLLGLLSPEYGMNKRDGNEMFFRFQYGRNLKIVKYGDLRAMRVLDYFQFFTNRWWKTILLKLLWIQTQLYFSNEVILKIQVPVAVSPGLKVQIVANVKT